MKTMIKIRIVSKMFDSWFGRKPIAHELRAARIRIIISGDVNWETKILNGLIFCFLVILFLPYFFSSFVASELESPFIFYLYSILILILKKEMGLRS